MSRRPSSSMSRTPSSTAAPYPRRIPGQPKSTRQQFSACGACRMRRVRCDLKDFYSTSPNGIQPPSCSNCRERNIRCVDEFAQVKAVKLLRRGRRLQQVEARYGKVTDEVVDMDSGPLEPTPDTFSVTTAISGHSCIPQMQLPFLKSSFFRRFCVQRPIIEPGEFAARYIAHLDGTTPLNIEGKILAMVLVTWAASLGIDEFGGEDTQDGALESHGNPHFSLDGDNLSNSKRRARLFRTEAMARELLTLVDLHGLLRCPSWDGVRVLLLLLPLTRGIQTPIEQLAIYGAALSQARLLCNLDDAPSVDSGLGSYCDTLIRARIFLSAHILEGITTALDGGRLVLNDDDLASFQSTLPPPFCASATLSISTPTDSPRSSPASTPSPTPSFPFVTPLESSDPRAALAYMVTTQYFSLALAVSQACRAIHATLTGPRARQQIKSNAVVRKEALLEIWNELERCWDNFETLRRNPSGVGAAGGDLIRGEDVERFVSGWQVLIFGCLNVIRQALPSPSESVPEQPDMVGLRLSAVQRCQKYLPRVIEMLQRHLKVASSFFAYDTGLIRDGCYFAGVLLAQGDKLPVEKETTGWDADWEEGVAACLEALREVCWVCRRSQEQERSLKAEWEARIERETHRQSPITFPIKLSPGHSPCLNDSAPLPSVPSASKPRTLSLVAAGGQVRPLLAPLSVPFQHDDSGPDTALTDDGSGSWEPYTPPSTAGSLTGAPLTHPSLSPISSPTYPALGLPQGGMKGKLPIFGDESDADLFSLNIDGTHNSRASLISGGQAQWAPFNGDYLDPRVMLTTSFGV